MHYPKVIGEFETLRLVCVGHSIARFGDGEFKIAKGGACVSQVADPKLSQELREILVGSNKGALIVGIPTMDPDGPKAGQWARYKNIYPRLLNPKKVYHSAFITRPDSAPWIDTPTYFDEMESLWRDKEVALVGCGERSLKEDFLYETGAKKVFFVKCARRDAYADIDALEAAVVLTGAKTAILCAGPTATCLAARLSKKLHAIDLGHVGMFWRRYEK